MILTAPSKSRFPRNPRKFEGGWLGLAIAGINALSGAISSNRADSAAERDRRRELELEERGLELAGAQDRRARELHEHYTGTYMPRERELVAEAFDRKISPAAAERRATTDVRGAFGNLREMRERRLGRLGVSPRSDTGLGLDIEEARIEAGARTRAREDTRGLNFSRQATVLGYGSPTAASPYASGAQAGVANVANLAGMRSRDSSGYAYEAGANLGAATGEFLDAGLEAWRRRRDRRDPAIAEQPPV